MQVRIIRTLLLSVAALGLAAATPLPGPPGSARKPLPEVELEGFTQTEASSLDDYFGRAVLIEFFAYW
jgi:hypothetical protein